MPPPDMVHVRGELPWLRSGPLFRVHVEARPELDHLLHRHDFRVLELDGRRMSSRASAHAELARAFGFPDYYGKNWDAFNDVMGDFVGEHSGERVAVLWHHIDEAAQRAPATTAEVGWALLDARLSYMPTLTHEVDWSIELHVFALGDGPDFDRP